MPRLSSLTSAILNDDSVRGLCLYSSRCSRKTPRRLKSFLKISRFAATSLPAQAAVAALAADRQGKFWEFHDELFNNYNRLKEEKVQEIAAKLKLNKVRFEKDRKDPLLLEQIRQDVNEGVRAGVRGVPSGFRQWQKTKR